MKVMRLRNDIYALNRLQKILLVAKNKANYIIFLIFYQLPHRPVSFLDGLKFKALRLYMHRFVFLALTDITLAVLLYPGTLQAVVELPIKFAWQEDITSVPSAHLTPSTDGTSILYIPYLFVVLFTDSVICSVVLAEIALNMQSTFTSAPEHNYEIKMC